MSGEQHDSQAALHQMVISSDLINVNKSEDIILQDVIKHGFTEEAVFAIKLTLEEALTNAIKHGNKSDRSKQVTIRYRVDRYQAVVYIRDEGSGFDPEAVPDPTAPDRLQLPSGRGILLMRAYMNDVQYLQGGREVFLRKVNE